MAPSTLSATERQRLLRPGENIDELGELVDKRMRAANDLYRAAGKPAPDGG